VCPKIFINCTILAKFLSHFSGRVVKYGAHHIQAEDRVKSLLKRNIFPNNFKLQFVFVFGKRLQLTNIQQVKQFELFNNRIWPAITIFDLLADINTLSLLVGFKVKNSMRNIQY